jgi:hypothetical protein
VRKRASWFLGAAGLVACAAFSAEAPARPVFAIDDLAWMEGGWSGEKDGVVSEEHWTGIEGGALVGMHKDVRAGKFRSFEFFRIVVESDGRICYLSSPGGAPPTSFCAIEVGARRVVFENREHDFPQRILYWLDGDGAMRARIEGTLNGKAESEEWIWRRMAEGAR